MSRKGKVTVDLGNSQTRAHVELETPKGDVIEEDFFLSNKFYKFEKEGINISQAYKPETSSIFSIAGDYVGAYANGEYVEKEWEKQAFRPSGKKSKASITSALSFTLAVIKGIDLMIAKYGMDSSDIDYAWDVVALMPPAQCTEKNIEAFEDELRKVKSITNHFTSNRKPYKLPININSVKVYPEGFSAYVGCMYTRDVDIRKGYEKYIEGSTILVVDIGAGTTDILIVVDGEVIENSKETFKFGGLNVRSRVKRLIREEYDYDNIADSDLEIAISTGKLKDGSKYHDVSEMVMIAKREVAKALVGEIQEYLNGIDYPLRRVDGALVVGGGTLGGEEGSNIEPISKAIMENLRDYSPNMGDVELPTLADGTQMSPRLINFEGAIVLANIEED